MQSSAERVEANQEDLIDVLAQTGFVITAVLSRVGAEHDLSLTQLRVLAILRDRRLRMSELADYLGLEKSTMSGLVDRAVKRGLLDRARNPSDGRVIDVLLTAHGSDLAQRLFAQVTESLMPVIKALTTAEQQQLQELLSVMLGSRTTGR